MNKLDELKKLFAELDRKILAVQKTLAELKAAELSLKLAMAFAQQVKDYSEGKYIFITQAVNIHGH
jgi:hypothetical protein